MHSLFILLFKFCLYIVNTCLIHNLFSKKVLTNAGNGYNIRNVVSTQSVRVLTDEKDGGKDVR